MYLDGKVLRRCAAGRLLARRAADHGNSEAEYLLGRMYRSGKHIAAIRAMAMTCSRDPPHRDIPMPSASSRRLENFATRSTKTCIRVRRTWNNWPPMAMRKPHINWPCAMRMPPTACNRTMQGALLVQEGRGKRFVPAMTSLADIYAKGLLGVKVDLVCGAGVECAEQTH